jgi:polyhydroxybutyrate depolymerase
MFVAQKKIMMPTLILSIALLLLGCAHNVVDPVAPMTRYVLEHGGLEREYFVFLPSSYDGKAELPVTLFLHGYGGTATGTEVEVAQGLNFYAEQYGYVMVYPQGTWFMSSDNPEDQWEVTTWNHISDAFDIGPDGPTCSNEVNPWPCPPECGSCGKCGWTSCHDDIGFLRALLATVATDFATDQDRFFVSGFSSGATMANRIACEASELFAAAALVGSRLERGFECTPTNRLPLLQINGGKDITIPPDGSESSANYFFASTTSTAEHWNDGEACAVERESWVSPTIDGTDAVCNISCKDSSHPAIDCIWAGGNHRWPGTAGFRGSNGYCVSELQAASMPDQPICIDADYSIDKWGSRLVFEFFDEHRASR